jgi:uroporphyrinogen-III synthase
MTKGLSNAITFVQKNLNLPTDELIKVLRPHMEEIIDYTAEPRKPDQREVEWDPQPIDYIVFTNPYGYQDELD